MLGLNGRVVQQSLIGVLLGTNCGVDDALKTTLKTRNGANLFVVSTSSGYVDSSNNETDTLCVFMIATGNQCHAMDTCSSRKTASM